MYEELFDETEVMDTVTLEEVLEEIRESTAYSVYVDGVLVTSDTDISDPHEVRIETWDDEGIVVLRHYRKIEE